MLTGVVSGSFVLLCTVAAEFYFGAFDRIFSAHIT
jgi:hypothetical protein